MHYRLLSLVASTNGYCLLVCYLSLFIYLKIIMAFINSPCMCTSRKDIVYSCKHDSIFYEIACKITRRSLSYSLHIRRSNKKGSSIENINTKLFWVKYSCIIVFNVYFRFNRKANHRRVASFFFKIIHKNKWSFFIGRRFFRSAVNAIRLQDYMSPFE